MAPQAPLHPEPAAGGLSAELPTDQWALWRATVGTAGALSGATAATFALSATAEGVHR